MLNLLRKPTATPDQLATGLAELGLNGEQHVIVHASLKSFGRLEGGARTVVDTLEQHTATLIAPAFTYHLLMSKPTSFIRAQFTRDTRVSRDIGAVPQTMVERAQALRSFHPVLSFIALGQHASDIVEHQTLENPYLPIGALYDLDGYALLMGVDFDSNTSIHYGEYLAGIPLLERYVPLNHQAHRTAFPNCSADFDELERHMSPPVRQTMVGRSMFRLYRVRDLVDSTVALLQRKPSALLCRYAHCRCQEIRQIIRYAANSASSTNSTGKSNSANGLSPRSHVPLRFEQATPAETKPPHQTNTHNRLPRNKTTRTDRYSNLQ